MLAFEACYTPGQHPVDNLAGLVKRPQTLSRALEFETETAVLLFKPSCP